MHATVTSSLFRNHASHFEQHKTAFEEGGGRDDAVMEDEDENGNHSIKDSDHVHSKA